MYSSNKPTGLRFLVRFLFFAIRYELLTGSLSFEHSTRKNTQNYKDTGRKQARRPYLYIAVLECPAYG